ncbi:MarR family transcriptional regulator [Neisseriaceae bacterium JH1-16]|nr:MarR family transcriptional regulator [Neisseriaceae bacterium JH1-16]
MSRFEQRLDAYCALNPAADRESLLLARLLILSTKRLRSQRNQALQPHGISYNHYATLALLAADQAEGVPTSPTGISELLDVSKAQVTKMVDALADKGWAERRLDEHDHRRFSVDITDEGKRELAAMLDIVGAASQRFASRLDAAQRHQLVGLLTRLLDDGDDTAADEA